MGLRLVASAGLLLGLLSGCGGAEPMAVSIGFNARFGATPFSCQEPVSLPGGQTLTATHLKLFVHDLRLVDEGGDEVPVRLVPDGRFQSDAVAQLDLEDGTGHCRNGSRELHTRVAGVVPEGTYRGLRFRVGVPFIQNHADPVRATPPLTDSSMHWSWQGGYKFLRFDARLGNRPLRVHLGSTGCQGTIGAISSCDRPNRPEVRLDRFTLDRPEVTLQLDALLGGLLAMGDAGGTGCMGNADEAGCGPLFSALGLDLRKGMPTRPTDAFTTGTME